MEIIDNGNGPAERASCCQSSPPRMLEAISLESGVGGACLDIDSLSLSTARTWVPSCGPLLRRHS